MNGEIPNGGRSKQLARQFQSPQLPLPGQGGLEPFAEVLASRRLLIVSGKGGVGRTSVALLAGLSAAMAGRRVLVATTGHDARLAWMVGLTDLGAEPRRVDLARFALQMQEAEGGSRSGHSRGGSLAVTRLDPLVCVRQYGEFVLRSRRAAGLVFDNALVRGLLSAVPGIDDFAVLGKVWHEAVRVHSYDLVVLDGPASGHLAAAMSVPRTIIETLPGGPLVAEAERISASLADPQISGSLWVALAERWPLTELSQLASELEQSTGLSSAGLVVNERLPGWDGATGHLSTEPSIAAMQARAQRQAQELDEWLAAEGQRFVASDTPLFTLNWQPGGIEGPEQTAALAAGLARLGAFDVRAESA